MSHWKEPVVKRLISRLHIRAMVGRPKYGATLEHRDLASTDWLRLYQERLLDAAAGIEDLLQELGMSGRTKPGQGQSKQAVAHHADAHSEECEPKRRRKKRG